MSRKLAYIALSTLIVILPLLIVSILLSIRFDATLFDHAPFWNDELFHWHQTVSFAEVGFNNGYYTLDENIPIASFSHYYAWGAWVYVFYGTIANLFGLPLHAIMTINLLAFMSAMAFFIATVRPSWDKLLLIGLISGTFIPLLLYMPSSLLQLLNLAIAIVFVAGFYQLLTRPVGWRFLLAMSIFAMLAGLIRPTYALFLAPMFALAETNRNFKNIILAGFKALPLFLITAVGFYTSAAPFPHFRTILFLGDDSFSTKLANFGDYIRQSFIWMSEGAGVVMAQRYQIAVLLILLIAWGIFMWWSNRDNEDEDTAWRWELALHLYNLLGFYTATILFHETLGGHDYRVMAPHLLFSLILLASFRRHWIVLIIVAMSLFWMPSMWKEYQYKDPNFNGIVQQQFADWASIMGDDLVYDTDASSPWCNTVTTSAFYVLDAAGQPGMLLSIDAGMGLSWAFDWVFPDFDLPVPEDYTIPESFQSRYLILTDEDYNAWGQALNLEHLERAPQGNLYLNLDVDCEG